MNYKVAIIILNWNSSDVTVECLDSLANIQYSSYKIFLVDNASQDIEYNIIKKYCLNKSSIHLVSLAYNYGFAEGNNIGMRIAQQHYDPDYYLLLNNDTLVDPLFLKHLVEQISNQNDTIGIAVPKIYFYEPKDHLYYAGGYINKLSGMGEHEGWKQKDNGQYNVNKKVTFANGCCMLISKKLYTTIGNLNRQFFANIEDVEYSYRCTNANFGIIYVCNSIVVHKEGYASKRNKGQWFRIYLSTRNLILFYKERNEWFKSLLFLPYFSLRWILYMTLKLLILKDTKSVKALYKGIKDGCSNRLSFVELPDTTYFRDSTI